MNTLARINELVEENKRLRNDISNATQTDLYQRWSAACKDLSETHAALEKQREYAGALKAKLDHLDRPHGGCDQMQIEGKCQKRECDCGFDAWVAELHRLTKAIESIERNQMNSAPKAVNCLSKEGPGKCQRNPPCLLQCAVMLEAHNRDLLNQMSERLPACKEIGDGPLTLKDTLHALRNPWGWSEESVRRVRLHAADLIEIADNHKARLLDAIRSCHSFESARVGHCLACTELSLIGNENAVSSSDTGQIRVTEKHRNDEEAAP